MTARGFSMIEILVALAIVAFAVLGLAALQARALSFQKDAFERKAAAELAAQLAERMRANHLGFASGVYRARLGASDTVTGQAGACSIPCSFAQRAARDVDEWLTELRRRMPTAAAYVDRDPANPAWTEVAIAWAEPYARGNDAACDLLRSAGVSVPSDYRCYRTRVLP